MAERSRFWDGSTVGDALSITDNELMDRFFRTLLNGTGDQGVLRGWLNELEVTDGGGLDAAIDTGGAILYGLFFESDAAEAVALPNNSTVMVIVSRDWATQTARLTHDGGAGLTQNPGVQYDIPLAEVTTVGGAITVITDARDYCEFSLAIQSRSVVDTSIQADAVTIAKMENQTRWLTRGYSQLYADGTNPATMGVSGWTGGTGWEPGRPGWNFAHTGPEAVWCTFQAPADMVGATLSVYAWATLTYTYYWGAASGEVRWAFSAQAASAGGALANQTGAATVTYPLPTATYTVGTVSYTYPIAQRYTYRDLIGTIPATAGDIIHLQFSRDPLHADDTWNMPVVLYMLEFAYEADS